MFRASFANNVEPAYLLDRMCLFVLVALSNSTNSYSFAFMHVCKVWTKLNAAYSKQELIFVSEFGIFYHMHSLK